MRRYTPLVFLPIALGLIFLYTLPLHAGKTGGSALERVSVASDGTQAQERSYYPSPLLSADGRYVGFSSYANNLVPTDTNNDSDSFLHDRMTGTTIRLSVTENGTEIPETFGGGGAEAISADNQWVLLTINGRGAVPTDTTFTADVFLRNLNSGDLTRISMGYDGTEPNGWQGSGFGDMTPDANWIVYQSQATNIIPTDTNGSVPDIYLFNRTTGVTTLVNATQDGIQADRESSDADISDDGTWVVFATYATNLHPQSNNGSKVFVRNMVTGELRLVSVTSTGVPANNDVWTGGISGNGRYIVLSSSASNLYPQTPTSATSQVYVHDLQTGLTEMVSVNSSGNPGDFHSYGTAISADGRYVAYISNSANLVPPYQNGQTHVYVYDRLTGIPERITNAFNGGPADGRSSTPSLSPDGRFVAFGSLATDLVVNDTNNYEDVFVYDRFAGGTPTPLPPTATPTNTPIATNTPTITNTPVATNTPTVTNTPVVTHTPTVTMTPSPTTTPPSRQLFLPIVRRN